MAFNDEFLDPFAALGFSYFEDGRGAVSPPPPPFPLPLPLPFTELQVQAEELRELLNALIRDEGAISAILNGADEETLTGILRYLLHPPVGRALDEDMKRDLFFSLWLSALAMKDQAWRQAHLFSLLEGGLLADHEPLKVFLKNYLPLTNPILAYGDRMVSMDYFPSWMNVSLSKAQVGVVFESSEISTADYGAKISQDIFRSFRGSLICQVAAMIKSKDASEITAKNLEEISDFIAEMRHFIAIVQSGEAYSESSLAYHRPALAELATPIEGPQYEHYLKLAEENGVFDPATKTGSVIYKGVPLVSYSEKDAVVRWCHGAPENRAQIIGFALEHLNALSKCKECGDEAFTHLAKLHYFLAATLPYDRGSSYVAEVIVNAVALAFFGKCLSWKGQLPDCHAYTCSSPDDFVGVYKGITAVHEAGPLNILAKEAAHSASGPVNPTKRAVATKCAMKRPEPVELSLPANKRNLKSTKTKKASVAVKKEKRIPAIEKVSLSESSVIAEKGVGEASGCFIFKYGNVDSSACANFFSLKGDGWGGRALKATDGTYSSACITIPQENVQAFFDTICDFSKGMSDDESAIGNRKAIIKNLYEAVKTVVDDQLKPLEFIEKEKRIPAAERVLLADCRVVAEEQSEGKDEFIVFKYEKNIDITSFCTYFSPGQKHWGSSRLLAHGGICEFPCIKIPRNKVWDFFQEMADFSNEAYFQTDRIIENRKVIITNLYEAAKIVMGNELGALEFKEKEKQISIKMVPILDASIIVEKGTEGQSEFFIFKYIDVDKGKARDFFVRGWGAAALRVVGGEYSSACITIHQEKVQAFFNALYHFPDETKHEKRKAIVTNLFKAAHGVIGDALIEPTFNGGLDEGLVAAPPPPKKMRSDHPPVQAAFFEGYDSDSDVELSCES